MKKLLLLSFSMVFALYSCSDGKDDPIAVPLDNELEFDGTRYDITGVTEIFYGENENGTKVFELVLKASDNTELVFEINLLNGERLPSGSYYFDVDGIEYTGNINKASLKIGSAINVIDRGTMKISANGDSRAITFDGRGSSGKILEVDYSGTVTYENESPGVDPLDNEFEFDGVRYPITRVTETYYGDIAGDGLEHYDLEFFASDDTKLNISGTRPIEEGEHSGAGRAVSLIIAGTPYNVTYFGLRTGFNDDAPAFMGVFDTTDGKTLELLYIGPVEFVDESPVVLENQVMVGDEILDIIEIFQAYHGYEHGDEVVFMELVVSLGPGNQGGFEVFIPAGGESIAAGEYEHDYSYEPFTVAGSNFLRYGDIDINRFSVSVEGGIHTIDIEGETPDGSIFRLAYSDELETRYFASVPGGTGYISYMGDEITLRYCEFDYYGYQEDEWPVLADLFFFNIDRSAEFWFQMWFPEGEFAGSYIWEEWDDGEIGPGEYTIDAGEGSAELEDEGIEFYVDFEDGEMTVAVEGDIYTITGTFMTDEEEELVIYYKGKIYGTEEMEGFAAYTAKSKNKTKTVPRKAVRRM